MPAASLDVKSPIKSYFNMCHSMYIDYGVLYRFREPYVDLSSYIDLYSPTKSHIVF